MSNKPPNPMSDHPENEIYQKTLQEYDPEVALAEELVNHLLEGTRLLERTSTTEPGRGLTRLLVLSALDWLKCALDLAFRGHYVQALSLVRNGYELWLAGAYANCVPHEAARLKRKNARWPEPSCMRRVVSARIAKNREESEQLHYALNKMYQYLSKFTHPSFLSIGGLIAREDPRRIGPSFDRNRLLISVDKVYRTLILLNFLLAHAFPALQETEWSRRSEELAQKVNGWRDRAVAEAEGGATETGD